VWKPNGKRPRGRPRLRWEDSIKAGIQDMGWGGLIWLSIGTGGGRL